MAVSVNVFVDAVFLLSIGIIIWRNTLWRQMDKRLQMMFRALAVCLLVIMGSDALAILLNGRIYPLCRVVSYILDSVYYIAEAIFCLFWVTLADYWCFRDAGRLERFFVLRLAPMLVEVILILLNPFLKWVFLINDKNIYERGDFYILNLLIFYFYFIYAVVLVIQGCVVSDKDPVKRRQNLRMLTYLILPFFGVIYVTVFSGFSVLWPLVSISVFLSCTDEQGMLLTARSLNEMLHSEQNAEQETALTKKSVSLFVRQLQPNFLFNSLSVIRELCDVDKDAAKEAVDNFTDYIRGNMSALNMEEVIPFETELTHIKSYLYLEKLRFHGKIMTIVDCKSTDFFVPPLGILVFVETAVRDGLTMKREGGTVAVSTSEDEKNYIVLVEDDGNGSNPLSLNAEEDSYLGVETSIQRIEHACGGKVKISAVFGEGMSVTITIPKNRKEKAKRLDVFS